MKRRMSSVIVVMAGILALFPALTHGAATTRTAAFHGSYKVTMTLANGIGTRQGPGQASQLGKSVLHSLDVGSRYGGAGLGAGEGEGTLKAQGGSMLRYAYVTEFHVDRTIPSTGYYVFEGGTGRFSGASGTGTIRQLLRGSTPANPTGNDTVQLTLVFQGTLNLVK